MQMKFLILSSYAKMTDYFKFWSRCPLMAISGHIFTKLAWMKHLMSLIGLKYESEHHVLNAGGGKGFWSRYKFVGAGAL